MFQRSRENQNFSLLALSCLEALLRISLSAQTLNKKVAPNMFRTMWYAEYTSSRCKEDSMREGCVTAWNPFLPSSESVPGEDFLENAVFPTATL